MLVCVAKDVPEAQRGDALENHLVDPLPIPGDPFSMDSTCGDSERATTCGAATQ